MKLFLFCLCVSIATAACPVGCLDFFFPDIQATSTIAVYDSGDKAIEQEVNKLNALFAQMLKNQKAIEKESKKLLELEKILELTNQNKAFIDARQNAVQSKNSDIRSIP